MPPGRPSEQRYLQKEYLAHNPTWGVEDSRWKATQILRMLTRNGMHPQTIAEVGCGAGEILVQLQEHLPPTCQFDGYDISPEALKLALPRSNERLRFHCEDFRDRSGPQFDVLLLVDVVEHVEDHIQFLRDLREHARQTILHIPLDLSAQTVLRVKPIMHARRTVGHLHYFLRETAIATLRDAGYDVLDSFYTPSSMELPNRPLKTRLLNLPRRLMYAIHPDFAVRLLGGYSLMVLAR